MPARNAGLSRHRPGKLNNSKWPLSRFSRARLLRPAFLGGFKPCDVIMHNVYSNVKPIKIIDEMLEFHLDFSLLISSQ
jgi:hypothetical protein